MTIKNKTLIQTKVPLSMEEIKTLYNNKDTVHYIVSYNNSSLKDKGFLFYLSNLELPADLSLSEEISIDEKFKLVRSYMELSNLIDIGTLTHAVAQIVLIKKGVDVSGIFQNPFLSIEQSRQFIDQNVELVDRWITFLDSLYVYALYTAYAPHLIGNDLSSEDHEEIRRRMALNPIQSLVPNVVDPSYVGNNFLYVTMLPSFYELYFSEGVDINRVRFFTHQFTEYCYKGMNLYHYFTQHSNWLLASVLVFLDKFNATDLPSRT